MLVDRYDPEDVFARVLEVAAQTDLVLKTLGQLLDDDPLDQQSESVSIPASGKHSEASQALERTRCWKRGYRWRAGSRDAL